MRKSLRLGVNVDHVATLRQVRGTVYPDPVAVARQAVRAGAHSITVHLREDRRHIQDHDVVRLRAADFAPVNLEMAVTPAMMRFACRVKPAFVCLVPERRQELTTEGGLDVVGNTAAIAAACRRLARAGITVALFIDPDARQLAAAQKTGAPHLEIHTGTYADAPTVTAGRAEQKRIAVFARAAQAAGFEVHAGHGLTVANVGPIAVIPEIVELNIGHSLIADALSVGLPAAVKAMLKAMRR